MRLFRLATTLAALAALGVSSAWAQQAGPQRRISGRVVVEGSNEPLASATVQVVGTNLGAITDEQGNFNLLAPQGDVTLRARRIGHQQRTVQVPAAQAEVTIALTRDVLQLEGVVVTGQTTTLDRANATTATTVVSAEEVTRAPARSLENALQGKVVGANINMNSGAPGGGGQIQIRGASSILGQGEPLVVVDGVIINNTGTSSGQNAITQAAPGTGGANIGTGQDNVVNRLGDINPNEVESIEVLKSAAATALYGSRATNGVIVIRTKRGQAGEVRTNITQRFGTQSLQRNIGSRRYTSVDQALATAIDLGIDTARVRAAVRPDGTLPYNDFWEQLYSNNKLSYESIATVSGGTERTRFALSGTQRREQGIALNTGARLQAIRLNLDQTITPRLQLSAGLNATRNLLQRGVSNNANDPNPSPVYIFGYTPSFLNLDSITPAGRYVRNPYNAGASSNPFETYRALRADEDVNRYFGNLSLNYTAFQNATSKVDLNVAGGVDQLSQEGEIYSPNFLQYEPVDNLPGTAVQSNNAGRNYNSSATATWLFTPMRGGYALTTSLGVSQETQEQNTYRIAGRGLLPGVPRSDIGSQTAVFQNFSLFRDQAMTFNAQLLAFEERLSITGGTRSDRSSANGDPERFYTFPRLAASYQFRNLLPGVDLIKPRVGYGETGNRPRYGDRDILQTATLIDGSRAGVTAATLVGNPNIKPEALVEYEAGVDATFLNQRISFEGTVFDRTITDLLLQPATALSAGVNNLVINAGELQTRGLELGLSAQVLQTDAFTWTSRATYQKNVQEINNLPVSVPAFPVPGSFGAAFGRNRIVPVSGTRTTYIWGNAPVELNADGTVARILPIGSYVTNPDAVDARRDTIIGDANPDFQMFFTNSFTFQRFGLSFLLDWRKGGDVANMTHLLYDEGQQSRDYDNRSPVDTLTLGQYRYEGWHGGDDARFYVQDGGFVKLREVALTFDVPETFVARLGNFSSLRLQLLGRNLFTRTDYWGADPEVNNFGNTNFNRFIDLGAYPPGRQFYFSFDLGL